MQAGIVGRRGLLRTTVAIAIALACLAWGSERAAAAEIETHLFNATLSLTGNCATSAQDLVPDPSCPYEPAPNGPTGRFNVPRGVAVDSYGDLFVANMPANREGGVVDVFCPSGKFVTEIADNHGPQNVAVDSEGHVYLFRTEEGKEHELVRYDPTLYEPDECKLSYPASPTVVIPSGLPTNVGIAVDPATDHVFVDNAAAVIELKSAKEGNTVVTTEIGQGTLLNSKSVAISPINQDIYASDTATSDITSFSVVKVFSGTVPGHPLIRTITGAVASPGPACPLGGHFSSNQGYLSVAIDGKTGHVFVYDAAAAGAKAVFEFDETGGECISKIERSFAYAFGNEIAIDNGANSPNGVLNPKGRFLYVPSASAQANSHVWAFEPKQLIEPPVVTGLSATEVTATDAELHATINPRSGTTHYTIEYTAKASFSEGEVILAKEGDLPAELADIAVSAPVSGLKPGTEYRFRVVAENNCETEPNPCVYEAEGTFTTFAPQPPFPPCENDSLRLELGSSALLPDCRAYELVSPPDTGGRALFDVQHGSGGDYFGSFTAAPAGGAVAFITRTGSLPGTEGAGGFSGTSYLSSRNAGTGWETEAIGPSGAQSAAPLPGGMSPDLGYSDTRVNGERSGSLVLEGHTTGYIRHPDGSFHLLGEGSEETDPDPNANYIAPNAAHIIYTSKRHLEEESPSIGTGAIYDRTREGNVLISWYPNETVPSQEAFFLGASYDGSGVAFAVGTPALSPIFVSLDDEETLEAAPAGSTFAGLSEDGSFVFYLEGGDLFRFDVETELAEEITTTADATVVNVPSFGEAVFFTSPSVLTGTEENPAGDIAQAGKENLYRWDEEALSFIGALTDRDVEGEHISDGGGLQLDGLGLWTSSLAKGTLAVDPSRSTPTGETLLFESRADLTHESGSGAAQVYRYDFFEDSLDCVSCNPQEAGPSTNASLQTIAGSEGAPEPLSIYALVPNLSEDGQRAFFQTSESLLPRDTDGVQDVYEWETQGTGSCSSPDGCLYLISSGRSARDNFLFGASSSGEDVFIWTSDLLLQEDADSTVSIYDARVDGGFPEPKEEETCEGEGCRPTLSPAPPLPGAETGPSGNFAEEPTPKKKCPKSKKRVKRHGKYVCVAKHHKHKHRKHHKSGRAAK
jgi:fibronectin type III domain protein